jgi:hypothetical protein
MKLSEATFKPLFTKLMLWSQSSSEETVKSNRQLTFYRLIMMLGHSLKSIFTVYLHQLFPECLRLLKEGPSLQLLDYLLSSLNSCFLYDPKGIVFTVICAVIIAVTLLLLNG